jgi:hypothetical protein
VITDEGTLITSRGKAHCKSPILVRQLSVFFCCRYPADRVPSRTIFKSRQGAGCAPTRRHMSCSTRSYLPAEVGSGAVTCPMALEPTFQQRWAQTSPSIHGSGPAWWALECHVSCSTGSCLPTEVGSQATTCLAAPGPISCLPINVGSNVTTCIMAPDPAPPPAGRAPGCHASYDPL